MAEASYGYDLTYEFDAPQFYDFSANPTGSTHSEWFAKQKDDGAVRADDVAAASRSPFQNITNEVKKANIVTSWGDVASKKRKADAGGVGQPSKAAKPNEASLDTEAVHVPKTRSQRSANKMAEKQIKKAKKLKAEAIIKKAKLKAEAITRKAKKPKDKPTTLALSMMATRDTKKLTIPEEVELHTSKRADAHQSKRGKQVEPLDDDEVDDHSDATADGSPYKPLVLRVKEFDKTPGRFKKQPDEPAPAKPLVITEPKEPKLRTSKRSRPSTFKPREVEEEEEMAKMPVFKASTLNPLILTQSGKLGVPIVEKRDLTEQQPFHFVTDDRAEARAARLQKQQATEAGPSKPKPRKSCWPVEPKSPNLHTKHRARESKAEEPKYEFHARPVPKFLSVPRLEVPPEVAPAPTKPAPFKLATEERGAQYQQALAAKLAAEEKAARQARIPRAQGLPLSTDMPMVPPKPLARNLTEFQPFELASEARHQHYEEQRRKALEDEEAARREAAAFKARPMWRGIPYRLHETEVPLTVPEEVSLHTRARATEREQFNKAMEEKIKEAEIAAQQAAEEARLREEEERRQARKAAVFRARPLPDLSAPPASKPPPPKPLTKPVSPCLGRKKRRHSSH